MIGDRRNSGGGLWERDGTMDRDGFLLSLHLFGGYLALQQPALSLILCNGAMSASVQHHNFDKWGIDLEAVEERGPGASGGGVDICVFLVRWRSSNKFEGAVIIII